jgi:ribosomal protein L29
MKIVEIRKMKVDELMGKANETKVEISELKRRISMGETTNVRTVRNKRKDLARMLTVIGEQLQKEKV